MGIFTLQGEKRVGLNFLPINFETKLKVISRCCLACIFVCLLVHAEVLMF